MAGWAHYGYRAAHSRWYWGLKLYLITTTEGSAIPQDGLRWTLPTPGGSEGARP